MIAKEAEFVVWSAGFKKDENNSLTKLPFAIVTELTLVTYTVLAEVFTVQVAAEEVTPLKITVHAITDEGVTVDGYETTKAEPEFN